MDQAHEFNKNGVTLQKIQFRLIWEIQCQGYQLGAEPEDGFLYFVKVREELGLGYMVSIFLKETDEKLSVSFKINGINRGDRDSLVLIYDGDKVKRVFITDYILDVIGKACTETLPKNLM